MSHTLPHSSYHSTNPPAMKYQDDKKSGSYSVPSAQMAREMAKAITYSSSSGHTRSSNIASKSSSSVRKSK